MVLNLMLNANKRADEFEKIKQEKYANVSCDINYEGIKKGDILLCVTRNALLMALDREHTVHHATLCIKTPESNDDEAFITIAGADAQVAILTLEDMRASNDYVAVLRCNKITNEQIESVVSYATAQIGKSYNMDFINKWDEEKFYCTQLVWASYQHVGIEIDSNGDEITDYGAVLASDISRSNNLEVVKYSE